MNKQDDPGGNQSQPLLANSMEAESLADLPLTAAQAEGTKAGIVGGASATAGESPYIVSSQDTRSLLPKPPASQGLTSNHNETLAEDEVVGMEVLADLPVVDDAQVKGGPVVLQDVYVTSYQLGNLDNNHGTHVAGTIGATGNTNHNETTTADEDNDTLADLFVAEAEQIKGGPICHGKTVLAWARVAGVSPLSNHNALSNHNETLAEDATAAAALADLRVQADEQIKGGPNKLGTGVLTLNGANTYLGTTSTASHGAGGGGGAGKVSVHDISITQ